MPIPFPDSVTILRTGLLVQASATVTLLLLGVADGRMRGMRWLSTAAALSVVAIATRLIHPLGVTTLLDLPVAAMYSLCALATYLGLRYFALENRRAARRFPAVAVGILLGCLMIGKSHTLLAVSVIRLLTMTVLVITVRMVWRTRSPGLRNTMRVAALVLVLILLVPACTILLGIYGMPSEQYWMFSRMAVASVITMIDFVFIAAYVAESKQRLYEGTRRDVLTGLKNRLAFEECAERELRLTTADRPMALLMLDLDNFKRLNDTWGHVLGDRALRAVSEVLQSVAAGRECCIARLGGEEFAILLPGLNEATAAIFAETLRAAVEAIRVPEARGVATMTMSLGVSEWATGEQEWASMLDRADSALYQAKDLGRNRVMQSSQRNTADDVDGLWPVGVSAAQRRARHAIG